MPKANSLKEMPPFSSKHSWDEGKSFIFHDSLWAQAIMSKCVIHYYYTLWACSQLIKWKGMMGRKS